MRKVEFRKTPSFEPHSQPTARLCMKEKVYKLRSAYLGSKRYLDPRQCRFRSYRALCKITDREPCFVIIITVCSNTYLFALIVCIYVSHSYDLNYMYAHRIIAWVFSPFSSPNDVFVYESSRHTSLDTDSL